METFTFCIPTLLFMATRAVPARKGGKTMRHDTRGPWINPLERSGAANSPAVTLTAAALLILTLVIMALLTCP